MRTRGTLLTAPAPSPVEAREGEPEFRPLARYATHPDPPTVQLHVLFGDVQTYPDAARLSPDGAVHLVEAVENLRHVLGRDADPGVPDAHQHLGVTPLGPDG